MFIISIRCCERVRICNSDKEEQVLAIFCYICKKEVKLISFGKGFVGICCNKVLYNYAGNAQFDMKQDEEKYVPLHWSQQKANSDEIRQME